MSQYVQLSADGTKVMAWYAGPQAIISDKPGYAVLADTDSRYVAYQTAQAAQANAAKLLAAGMQLASTGTPALDGTYAVDAASVAHIAGIYAGIKDGDGLPGGGTTFNYPDLTGVMHAFDATSFPNFAKAVRNFLYAVAQGQTPTQPVTIP